jgi:hypothetical protein
MASFQRPSDADRSANEIRIVEFCGSSASALL